MAKNIRAVVCLAIFFNDLALATYPAHRTHCQYICAYFYHCVITLHPRFVGSSVP